MKSDGYLPPTAMFEMVKSVVPVLVTVIVFVALVPTFIGVKVRLVGLNEGTGLITIAERGTCCGLPGALSVMFRVPESEPIWLGEKFTATVQLFPAAILPSQ